ncbi:MAG: hypothetical protein V9G19_02285 [Tetrasphaera sp.]
MIGALLGVPPGPLLGRGLEIRVVVKQGERVLVREDGGEEIGDADRPVTAVVGERLLQVEGPLPMVIAQRKVFVRGSAAFPDTLGLFRPGHRGRT